MKMWQAVMVCISVTLIFMVGPPVFAILMNKKIPESETFLAALGSYLTWTKLLPELLSYGGKSRET
jgi:hypothetical protein